MARAAENAASDEALVFRKTSDGSSPETRALVFDTWHFDRGEDDRWIIRHVPSGIAFRRSPQWDDRFAVAALSPDPGSDFGPMKEHLPDLALAARFAGMHASLIVGVRHHPGAAYFRYSQRKRHDPYFDPDTWDPVGEEITQ